VKFSPVDHHDAVGFWQPAGNTLEDGLQVARWAEQAGADALHVSTGSMFPHPRNPLDLALDVWCVLSRVRSLPALSADVRRRAETLASTIAAQLRATVWPEPAMSTAERICSPYHRVLAVDAGLAALWASI